MTRAASRGWLLAALVLAVALLVTSIAIAVPAMGRSDRGAPQGWHDGRTSDSMMGRADWDSSGVRGRADQGEDCLDMMRGREDR